MRACRCPRRRRLRHSQPLALAPWDLAPRRASRPCRLGTRRLRCTTLPPGTPCPRRTPEPRATLLRRQHPGPWACLRLHRHRGRTPGSAPTASPPGRQRRRSTTASAGLCLRTSSQLAGARRQGWLFRRLPRRNFGQQMSTGVRSRSSGLQSSRRQPMLWSSVKLAPQHSSASCGLRRKRSWAPW